MRFIRVVPVLSALLDVLTSRISRVSVSGVHSADDVISPARAFLGGAPDLVWKKVQERYLTTRAERHNLRHPQQR